MVFVKEFISIKCRNTIINTKTLSTTFFPQTTHGFMTPKSSMAECRKLAHKFDIRPHSGQMPLKNHISNQRRSISSATSKSLLF